MESRNAFGNLGRAGSAKPVIAALNKLERRPRYRIFLNEIGEGDSGYNDAALVREALSDSHVITHADTKEPIAVPKSQKIKRQKVFWRGKGVKHQSPNRTLHETWMDGGDEPDEVLIGGHFYAGAKNGQRPPKIKKILVGLYMAMFWALKARIAFHHRRGRHVVWMIDTNWRGFKRLHRKEKVIFSAPPDRGCVISAPGWEAEITDYVREDQPIEKFHDLHFATIKYTKRGRR